jgi:hypothetical protein
MSYSSDPPSFHLIHFQQVYHFTRQPYPITQDIQQQTFPSKRYLLTSTMEISYLFRISLWFLPYVYAIADPLNHSVQKRSDGTLSCSQLDVSLACISTNVVNVQGFTVLEALLFAMRNSSLPDSTTYGVDQNIICVSHTSGPTIQFTASAGVGNGVVSAGGSITTNITIPASDSGGKI